jgi:hypothetical protein
MRTPRAVIVLALGLEISLVLAARPILAAETEADVDGVRIRYRTPPTAEECCGVDSLYICARVAGARLPSLPELESKLPATRLGVSVAALADVCREHGVAGWVLRLPPPRLSWCDQPMILHVRNGHYVAFLGWDGDRLLVFDNAVGLFDCSPAWFERQCEWRGVAIAVGSPSWRLLLLRFGPTAGIAICAAAACWIAYRILAPRHPRTSAVPDLRRPSCAIR